MKSAPGGGESSRIEDVVNYDVQPELTDEQMSLIRNTFKDNPELFNVLRKVFLPSIGDMNLPIEKMGADPFMKINWKEVQADEAKAIVLGIQNAVKFVLGGLIQLKVLANSPVETEQEKKLRLQKNSNK